MASQGTAPKARFCTERQRLGDEYVAALRDVLTLQEAEFGQVVQHGTGLAWLDLALEAARRARDKAKTAYLLHLAEHGC
jgi:hypothetical protein